MDLDGKLLPKKPAPYGAQLCRLRGMDLDWELLPDLTLEETLALLALLRLREREPERASWNAREIFKEAIGLKDRHTTLRAADGLEQKSVIQAVALAGDYNLAPAYSDCVLGAPTPAPTVRERLSGIAERQLERQPA
jgi:hypothetical protein